MPTELTLETTEQRARQILDARITSVRDLVLARQRLTELRETLTAAEREDHRLYTTALNDGWTPDELRKLGLSEPDKKNPTRRRTRTPRTGSDTQSGGSDD